MTPEPIHDPTARRKVTLWQKLVPWLITLACFGYLLTRVDAAAARDGLDLAGYLGDVFRGVDWGAWLALMIPYSAFFFLVDSAVVWRVINWFNVRLGYRDILPIRGSSYILSILNEQVGKGAMGVYLHRRHGVPGWEVGSSMIFIMFCEFYYLLFFATLGYAIAGDRLPSQFAAIPWIALAALVFFAAFYLFMRGHITAASHFRERPIWKAFREARITHYLQIVLIRSPALLAAVVVYTIALRLFGVPSDFIGMLGVLPVIFFGAATPGPMRSVAITLWVVLFPGHEGALAHQGGAQIRKGLPTLRGHVVQR